MLNYKKGKCEVDYFSYLDFLDYISTTDRHSKNYNSSESNDYDFTGSESYKEAYDNSLYGWDSGLEKLKENWDLYGVIGTNNIGFDVVGSFPDIPRYLSGVPDNMVKFEDKIPRDRKKYCLLVNFGYNCSYSSEDGLDLCKKILYTINNLNVDYDVKVIGYCPSHRLRKGMENLTLISIKEYEERLVLNSIAYSFHPSFFRRLWFKYLETKEYICDGYGTPVDNDGDKAVVKFLKKNGIVELIKNTGYEPDVIGVCPSMGKMKKLKTNEKFLENITQLKG